MSDLVRLSRGAVPWQPTPTSAIVEIYNEYDQPLLGLLRQNDGTHYLFDCVWGHVESMSVWLYSHVTESEAETLRTAEGEDWERLKHHIQTASPAVVAISLEGEGLIVWGVAEQFPGDFRAAIADVIARYREHLARLEQGRSDIDELAATNADVVAAR